jgi:hypothetical protein
MSNTRLKGGQNLTEPLILIKVKKKLVNIGFQANLVESKFALKCNHTKL